MPLRSLLSKASATAGTKPVHFSLYPGVATTTRAANTIMTIVRTTSRKPPVFVNLKENFRRGVSFITPVFHGCPSGPTVMGFGKTTGTPPTVSESSAICNMAPIQIHFRNDNIICDAGPTGGMTDMTSAGMAYMGHQCVHVRWGIPKGMSISGNVDPTSAPKTPSGGASMAIASPDVISLCDQCVMYKTLSVSLATV